MAKKNQNDVAYIARRGLVKTHDPEVDRPLLRRPGFNGIPSFAEMETSLSSAIRAKRAERNLTREQLATMTGLSAQVFGRYEKAISKMHVTRLIHLCEILDSSPVDLLCVVAPHLFGATPEEAEVRAKAMSEVAKMPADAVASLYDLLTTLISGGRPRQRCTCCGTMPTQPGAPDSMR